MNINCKIPDERQYDELIDFINYVFGFDGNSKDFKKLLPKLYLPENMPACHNYIVEEDGKIRAAVGAYDNMLTVCNVTLNCRGIGNVAVHPYSRAKGYMKECMNAALSDMVKDGIHLSTLGGRRHRYNYFGYDSTGTVYTFLINSDNMRHELGSSRTPKFIIKKVSVDDTNILDEIYRLNLSGDFRTVRYRENLYNILISWNAEVYAAFDGESFVGYTVKEGDNLTETMMSDDRLFLDFVTSLYDSIGASKLVVYVPPFKKSHIKQLFRFSEGVGIGSSMFFNVLNYKTVVEAFMKLKSTCSDLPDGCMELLIHGYAKDENLRIEVSHGEISVTEAKERAKFEIGHIDAMGLLFGKLSPDREELPDYAKVWFPLPLWQYRADEV